MIRKTMFAVATVAAIGAAALIPTQASAGGGGKGGHHGHWGHGYGFGGIVVIEPSCWRGSSICWFASAFAIRCSTSTPSCEGHRSCLAAGRVRRAAGTGLRLGVTSRSLKS